MNGEASLEDKELIDILKASQYKSWIKLMLSHPEIYNKSGKLKKTRFCKLVNCKIRHLQPFLDACREILIAATE